MKPSQISIAVLFVFKSKMYNKIKIVVLFVFKKYNHVKCATYETFADDAVLFVLKRYNHLKCFALQMIVVLFIKEIQPHKMFTIWNFCL